jgi:hypothetical protein
MPRSRSIVRPRGFNQPPKDQQWWWFTVEMLEHPSFAMLTRAAYQVLLRLCIECCRHNGNYNGRLKVTYNDFVKYGVHRHRIALAVRELEALGYIKCKHGRPVRAEFKIPSLYTLTFRPTETPAVQAMTADERACFDAANSTRRYGNQEPSTAPATNEWKGRARTIKEARAIIDQVRGRTTRSGNRIPVTVIAPAPVTVIAPARRQIPVAVIGTPARAETGTPIYTLPGVGGRAAGAGAGIRPRQERAGANGDNGSGRRQQRDNGSGRRQPRQRDEEY